MDRGITNAKQELLRCIRQTRTVVCAHISYSPSSLWEMDDETSPPSKEVFLKVGYTQADWETFLNELDFRYDSGYGGQELHGIVWFEGDSWMERHEYDGSENWVICSKPNIPLQCK
jgi:hypothetical protein